MGHEVLLDFFKARPSLAAELLTEVLGVPLPAYTEARLASIDLTQIKPAEYRADAVVLLLDGGVPVRVIIVEVQITRDDGKLFAWPVYLTTSRKQHGCRADLLVVAPIPAVADWCAKPIEIGPAGFVLHPPVLRREAIPVVTDPVQAALRVELALLSAMAHGEGEEGELIGRAVLPAILGLDDDRARFYFDILLNSVNEAARQALEAMMKGYEYQSEFAKKYYGQGQTAGRAEGEVRALLAVLRGRGIAVPDAARERITAEKDAGRLERWLERAGIAASVDEVLAEPS